VVAEAAEWVYWSWLFTPPVASNVLIPLGELDYATPNRSGNHNLRLKFGAHHRLGGTLGLRGRVSGTVQELATSSTPLTSICSATTRIVIHIRRNLPQNQLDPSYEQRTKRQHARITQPTQQLDQSQYLSSRRIYHPAIGHTVTMPKCPNSQRRCPGIGQLQGESPKQHCNWR